MKKSITLFALTLGVVANAQISTVPDENIDPADSLEIIFDPAGLDLSDEPQDLLVPLDIEGIKQSVCKTAQRACEPSTRVFRARWLETWSMPQNRVRCRRRGRGWR